MKTAADKFEEVERQLMKLLDQLQGELGALKGGWEGASKRSFDSVNRAFDEHQRKLSAALRETAAGVRSSGANYSATSQQTAASFNGVAVPDLAL